MNKQKGGLGTVMTPVVPAPRTLIREDFEFTAIVGYRVPSQPGLHCGILSQTKKNHKKQVLKEDVGGVFANTAPVYIRDLSR